MARKSCCVDGCTELGAFSTYTRPTWCSRHLNDVYENAGVALLEEFTKPTKYLLTRCLTCHFEGHYRFEYVLEHSQRSSPVCRACYWRKWAQMARRLGGSAPHDSDAKTLAEMSGYTYLGPLTDPSIGEDPHAVRCNHCGRIEAQRPGDIGFGCTCNRNPKSRTAGAPKSAGPHLVKLSDGVARDWWDHNRNPDSLWQTARLKSRKLAWWKCDKGHEFQLTISELTDREVCPSCSLQAANERRQKWEQMREELAGKTVADVPQLLAAWDESTSPETQYVDSGLPSEGLRFRCPDGHVTLSHPLAWLTRGCAPCKAATTRRKHLEAAESNPDYTRLTPEIASQWHPTKNEPLKRSTISPESRRKIWWLDPVCGHEFIATPRERDKYQRWRCPECNTVLDSLAFHYPEIAEEWSNENRLSAWHVRPHATTLQTLPEWICRKDPSHSWNASPSSRVNGSRCPMCRTAGKSEVELLYARAASDLWVSVLSGQRVRSPKFINHASWSVDILASLPDGRSLVIEYDGSSWHRDKVNIDREKTLDLLTAGYLVCRLRESPLPSLEVESEPYFELEVYSGAQAPESDLRLLQSMLIDRGHQA